MFHLDLHNMTQLLIYSGMSNGYRISTDEFKDMNFLLTKLKSTYQVIDYEYSKMDKKEKENHTKTGTCPCG